jgi:hypothetical protein
MKLPDQGHIIPPDIFIGGYKRHFFGKSGCDKQTVKGVTMSQSASGLRWSLPSANSTNLLAFKGGEMSGLNGEYSNVPGLRRTYKTSSVIGKAQFAYVNLDCHFPGGNYAQVYGIGKVSNNPSGSLRKRISAIEKPNGSMSVQQVAAHLHIVLEVVKGRVKVVCHPDLPFKTAECPLFQLRLRRYFGRKGKNNRPCWNLAGNLNRQPVAGWYVYSLLYGHSISILKKHAGGKK